MDGYGVRARSGWIGLAITCFVLAGLWFWFDSAWVPVLLEKGGE